MVVEAGVDAGHDLPATKSHGQAECDGDGTEGDQDQVVERPELDLQLLERRDADHQHEHVVDTVGQLGGVRDAQAIGAGGHQAAEEVGQHGGDGGAHVHDPVEDTEPQGGVFLGEALVKTELMGIAGCSIGLFLYAKGNP